MRDCMMMTLSGRRSTAMSRGSHSILRKGGCRITVAALTFMSLSPSSRRTPGPIRRVLEMRHCGKALLQQETPGVMGPGVRRDDGLPWRHPNCAVEADGFAVDHRIFHDVHGERAIFGGIAEPRRM